MSFGRGNVPGILEHATSFVHQSRGPTRRRRVAKGCGVKVPTPHSRLP
jgi:hypothetical protein